MLLMFPLGLFWMAFVFDLAVLLGAPSLIGTVAFWNLVAGLIGGLLAVLAAGVEAFTAPNPEAARIFFLALLLDVGVLIVFAVLTLMRVRGPERSVDGGLLALEAAALALAGFSAWFSGRLADPAAPVSDPRPRPHRRGTPVPGLDTDPAGPEPGGYAPPPAPGRQAPPVPGRYPTQPAPDRYATPSAPGGHGDSRRTEPPSPARSGAGAAGQPSPARSGARTTEPPQTPWIGAHRRGTKPPGPAGAGRMDRPRAAPPGPWTGGWREDPWQAGPPPDQHGGAGHPDRPQTPRQTARASATDPPQPGWPAPRPSPGRPVERPQTA
ncbi:DUF2231 domain-containing protein [Actinoplanes sp. NPDC049802]|uniref:DUF2231 domain-containing protein n=1 Tax=Actinoplanes sp. NPDC049802 TaxID=3154742 RepID=UPI0033FD55B0